jgi:fumarate hydratase subunit beta
MKKIHLPLTNQTINSLKPGDYLELTGTIYTARDQAHKKLVEDLKNGKKIPLPPDAVIYYAGPSPAPKGKIIGSCGPTTSSRMDAFTPFLADHGLKFCIGKGSRSLDVVKALKKHHGIYFMALGGCGALYQTKIKKAKLLAYPELLSEAIYELTVQDFPVIVA